MLKLLNSSLDLGMVFGFDLTGILKYPEVRNFILLILTTFVALNSMAQEVPPKPAVCTTAPAGYQLGGFFNGANETCLPDGQATTSVRVTNTTDNSLGQFSSVSYYFGMTDDVDITDAGFSPELATLQSGAYRGQGQLPGGIHWILQIGEVNNQKYLACKTVRVLSQEEPVAEIFTCDGQSVTIRIEDAPENIHDRYLIDWGIGTEELIDNPTLPYEQTRTYTGDLEQVSIKGQYVVTGGFDKCTTAPLAETPSEGNPPVLTTLKTLNGGAGVKIGFKNYTTGEDYLVQFAEDNGGTYDWKNLGTATNGVFEANGLNQGSKYCFRIMVEGYCGTPVYSNVICGFGMSATQSSSSDVTINWTFPTSPGGVPQQLGLVRTEDGCDSCLDPLSLNSNVDTGFTDNNLECGKIYNYTLTARYAIQLANGQTEYIIIESEDFEVDPMNGNVKIIPNGVINVGYPSTDDSLIKLVVYSDDDAPNYTFFHKSPDENDFIKIGSGTNTFEDISVVPNSGSYCYKYQVEDACGIESELSPEFCSVFLTAQGNTLNWTDYSFPDNVLTNGPAEYVIEMWDADIGAFLPAYRTSDLTQGVGEMIYNSTTPTLRFRIRAEQDLDLEGYTDFTFPSYSNTVVIDIPANVYIPSAFTPNGDGMNDRFEIKSKFLDSGTITIFDRWGGVVYEGDVDGSGWNGSTLSGQMAPTGSYGFRIKGVSLAGEEFSQSGSVSLLK
ncbi:T9SS type B sorting domain-containing protein [Jiulongibacter sp. NS-SX5]|uniref:T9SS type B sorting domain-containing protein n=1 Tax=Jiulongibacter sp. NS-SX5 TaxID=3463854 RepID=UPI004058DA6F